jgi:hypothetical protein
LYNGDKSEPLLLQQRDEPESAHTNPTNLPDRFLLSMQPIFQIRHPALMFPSMLRAQSRTMDDSTTRNPRVFCSMTLSHSRALYDWYLENGDKQRPRVIDADDIMNEPAVVRQLCIETGLDPDAVQYEWEEQHEENPLKASFLSTINGSKGIIKGLDSRNLNIEVEKIKWETEFTMRCPITSTCSVSVLDPSSWLARWREDSYMASNVISYKAPLYATPLQYVLLQ